MEENNFMEKKRPDFLAVLCVLTFIGSGVKAIVSLINSLSKSKTAEELYNQTISLYERLGGAFADQADSISPEQFILTAKYQKTISGILLILSIATIFAAVKMWNLKKNGFYMYIAAQALYAFVPLFFYGAEASSLFMLGWFGFWTLVFSLLYGVNSKYLK